MTTWNWVATYFIAAGIFLIVDLTWLGLVANDLYAKLLGDLKRDSPNWIAALAFYAIFIGGLVWFVLRPALEDGGDLGTAALNGAIYGLVTYATFDLTNAAVIKGYPMAVVPIDMAWGTVLSCIIATGSTLAARELFLG